MAQAPTGVILGAVSDPSGGVIPKATVTLENKALSVRRTATTDAAGSYSFTALPPGSYEVKATAGGFAAMTRSVHESDVPALAARFNSEYAGKRDAQGALIAPIPALPAKYQLGDAMWSQDLRLTKTLAIRERYRISGVAEVFNLFNVANLGGFSGDLYNAKFGQPTSRMNNVFGTGGPRAFQFALRFGF